MTESRRGGMTDDELEILADKLTFKLAPSGQCKLTEEQQRAVVDLITTKKQVVRWTLYIVGAMILWVAKDIYLYIAGHIAWGGR